MGKPMALLLPARRCHRDRLSLAYQRPGGGGPGSRHPGSRHRVPRSHRPGPRQAGGGGRRGDESGHRPRQAVALLDAARLRHSREGQALVGDVDFEAVRQLASAITPVPGGVGPHHRPAHEEHGEGRVGAGLSRARPPCPRLPYRAHRGDRLRQVAGPLPAGRAGLHTLDLDVVAHEVMAPGGSAYATWWRPLAPGSRRHGSLDRKALGGLDFPTGRAPEAERARASPGGARRGPTRPGVDRTRSVVVTDAALLVEAGLHLRFDRLVVVHCPPEVQLQRLMARDGIGEARPVRASRADADGDKRRFAHFEVATAGCPGGDLGRGQRPGREEIRMICLGESGHHLAA